MNNNMFAIFQDWIGAIVLLLFECSKMLLDHKHICEIKYFILTITASISCFSYFSDWLFVV